MRISDWSSDVCSSDLLDKVVGLECAAGGNEVDDAVGQADQRRQFHRTVQLDDVHVHAFAGEVFARGAHLLGGHAPIGRASCRESVCQYVYIPVVAVSLQKKKQSYTKQD